MSTEQSLTVRAPVRIDFAGGPSDMAPFCVDEWGYVVNAAIARYATVTVRRRADAQVILASADLGRRETYASPAALRHDSPLRLITRAVEMAGVDHGLEVTVRTDVPPGSGLGASAAVSVALLHALRTLRGETGLRREDLANDGIALETGRLQNAGGGQDQWAAAFGGVAGLRFAAGGSARQALDLPPDTLRALADSLVLCYSGTSRISGDLLASIMARYTQGDAAAQRDLRALREIALRIQAALLVGRVDTLGPLMTEAWVAFQALQPAISTPVIARIFEVALAAGATGGKAMGAGGGGCVLLACAPGRQAAVTGALRDAGFTLLPVQFAESGVRVDQGTDETDLRQPASDGP